MASLRDIQRRINSVTSTRQITHTMEMVSTTKIMKALSRADNAGPYKDAIQHMLETVAGRASSQNVELLSTHSEIKRALIVGVASDRGLAGGFNVQVERAIQERAQELEARGIEVEFISCGKKLTEFFSTRGIEPVLTNDRVSTGPTVAGANQISSYIMEAYVAKKIDLVELIYQHAKSRVEQVLTHEQLLPVQEAGLALPTAPREKQAFAAVDTQTKAEVQGDFSFEPSADEVLGHLIPSYIRTVIYHALIDSEAAEHGARRLAMQAATKNADDIISRLSREYNRIRQGSITTELSEIVGGAEALQEKEA